MWNVPTAFAVGDAHKALVEELMTAVGRDDVAKVEEIFAEVAKGDQGRYRVQRVDPKPGESPYVAVVQPRRLADDRSTGSTPLHWATSDAMRSLLLKYGADPKRLDLVDHPSQDDEPDERYGGGVMAGRGRGGHGCM